MLKAWKKKVLRHPFTVKASAWLLAKYMVFVYKTNRWQWINCKPLEALWNNQEPVIACFWHNRLGMMTFSWKSQRPFYMLNSNHPDGRIASFAIQSLGIRSIGGSSNKGSIQALREILSVLKQGHAFGITPDGPSGPRFSISPGLINLAKKANAVILPVSYATSRRRVLSTWDRLIIPLPFGKGTFICGTPIEVGEKDLTCVANELRDQLISISNKVDAQYGFEPIPVPAQKKTAKAA